MPNSTPEHVHDPSTLLTAFGRDWCVNCPELESMRVYQISGEEVELYKEFQKEFLAIHYEPEHEEGETCWCKPLCWVENGKYRIDHIEQRKILRALFWSFIMKYTTLMAKRYGV